MSSKSSEIFDNNLTAFLAKFSVRRTYEYLVYLYLLSILFLYPYGIILAADSALRIPDLFALPCLWIGFSVLIYRQQLKPPTVGLWPVFPVIVLEVFLPIIGIIVVHGGVGGLANGLRMLLLWGPMLLYVCVLVPQHSSPQFHGIIRKILVFSILSNIAYSIIQILAKIGILPKIFVITSYLEPIALEGWRAEIQGLRAQGFFINSTALAVFGVCCVSYFLSSYYESKRRGDLLLVTLSCFLILLSISRAALAGMIVILFIYLFFTNAKRAIIFLLQFSILAAVSLLILSHYIGLEAFFSRINVFLSLGASGALQDYSFQTRFYDTWPTILAKLHAYPFGTFVSSSAELGLIDSGYLTYYAQGKWLFILAFAILIAGLVFAGMKTYLYRRNGARLAAFFLAIFLTGGMIVANPIRNPLMAFMLIYFLWQAYEKGLSARSAPSAGLSK